MDFFTKNFARENYAIPTVLAVLNSILTAPTIPLWSTGYQEDKSLDENIHNIQLAINQVANEELVYSLTNLQDFEQVLENLYNNAGPLTTAATASKIFAIENIFDVYTESIRECNSTIIAIDKLRELGSQYIAGDEAAFELITGEEEVTVEFIDEIISCTSGLECDSRIFEPFLGQIKQSMMTCMNTIKTMI